MMTSFAIVNIIIVIIALVVGLVSDDVNCVALQTGDR